MLIADSGSTKTTWVWSSENGSKSLITSGINVHFQPIEEQKRILLEVKNWINGGVNHLVFYGTGLTGEDKIAGFANILNEVFLHPQTLEIYTDTLGAARALFGKSKGLSCILGTGASVGLYDGLNLAVKVPSLGFWLGDEGSGAYLGKELLKAYLRGLLEKEISAAFESEYGQIERSELFDIIKNDSRPNAYFASYTPFVHKFMEDSDCIKSFVERGFNEFIKIYVLPYELTENDQIGFIGSVGYYFQKEISEALKNKKIEAKAVFVKDPMDGLISYHM